MFAAYIVVDHVEELEQDLGPKVTNQVVLAVGETVVRQCRSYDLAAQYQDDAFMVVLDRVDRTVIDSIAARFAASIAALDWVDVRPGLQISATVVASNLAEHASIERQLAELEHLANARRVDQSQSLPANAAQG